MDKTIYDELKEAEETLRRLQIADQYRDSYRQSNLELEEAYSRVRILKGRIADMEADVVEDQLEDEYPWWEPEADK